MISAPWQEWQGRTVDGKFPLLQYLGGNHQSAVFLTQFGEPELQKAAIKLVRAAPADRQFAARWERASQLSHPNLIALFQTGSCEVDQVAVHYAVMEYAEEVLATVLRERPLTPEETRPMLESALNVLAYLHGQGLAHARLKPSNILAMDDRLKISCDGIRESGELPEASEETSSYDPPELREGGYSPAGDVWSLGITLVEALTGQLPARTDAYLDLPVPFRGIGYSCLQNDPQRRLPVASLAARLRPKSDYTETQTTVNPREASSRWRYGAPAGVLGLAFLLGLGLMHRRPEAPQAASLPPVQAKVVEEPVRQKPVQPPVARPSQTGSADRVAGAPVASVEPVRPSPKVKSAGQPGIVHQVMPEVPGKARETIHGTVRLSVRAHVDPSGRVTRAEIASAGPSSYFADLSLRAVRRWEFEPARVKDQDAASVWLLKFELMRSGTKVRPVRVSP